MKYSVFSLGVAALIGSLVVAAPNANAGWGHLHGGSSGYYGSSGSYGSSGVYAASYGSSGTYASYGSSGTYASSGGSSGYLYASSGGSSGFGARFRAHMAAKRARHAARRAAYASSGHYASSGGSSGYTTYSSHGSSGSSGYSYRASYGSSGSYSSHGSSGVYRSGVSYGTTYYGASTRKPSTAASMVSNVQDDAVYLTVAVPNEAKIFVNGNTTKSTGPVREFVSRGLKGDKSYKFEVRAELEDASGETIVENKTLVVSAGQRQHVQFDFTDNTRPVETAVTLNVPDGATISLAGHSTKAVGSTRTFRTKALLPGQVWDDYEIEVRHGEKVKRQSIRLIGGDNLQLTFAFEDDAADKIASR